MSITDHDAIDAFLQQISITRLWEELQTGADYQYNKSGVVPFVRKDGAFHYYVMKPQGKAPGLGKAMFQLCKGTRQYRAASGEWLDIRSEEGQAAEHKETLAGTALREGNEELGLKLQNISALWDLGAFSFKSATTGKTKYMWLYAGRVKSQDDFLKHGYITESTAERQWVTLAEFSVVGRPDHVYVLEQIEATLTKHLDV